MRVSLLVLLCALGCSSEVADEPSSYSVRWAERPGGDCGPVDDTATANWPLPATDCLGTAEAAECDVQGRTFTGSITCSGDAGDACVFDAGDSPRCGSVYDLTFTPSP